MATTIFCFEEPLLYIGQVWSIQFYFCRRIDILSQEYGRLKGMRKLEWKANLGMVDVSVCVGGCA